MSDEPRKVRPWDLFNAKIEKLKYSDDVVKGRMEICRKCPHFFAPAQQCKICHCIMPAKTKIADASCPQGLWGPVPPDTVGFQVNNPDKA